MGLFETDLKRILEDYIKDEKIRLSFLPIFFNKFSRSIGSIESAQSDVADRLYNFYKSNRDVHNDFGTEEVKLRQAKLMYKGLRKTIPEEIYNWTANNPFVERRTIAGFYHVFYKNPTKTKYRLYLNPNLRYFNEVCMELILSLDVGMNKNVQGNQAKINLPLKFKVCVVPYLYDHSHKIIIYCDGKEILGQVMEVLSNMPKKYFYPSVPHFTQKMSRGIGYAFEPGKSENEAYNSWRNDVLDSEKGNISFGMWFSTLASRIIFQTAQKNHHNKKQFLNFVVFLRELKKNSLDTPAVREKIVFEFRQKMWPLIQIEVRESEYTSIFDEILDVET